MHVIQLLIAADTSMNVHQEEEISTVLHTLTAQSNHFHIKKSTRHCAASRSMVDPCCCYLFHYAFYIFTISKLRCTVVQTGAHSDLG